MRIVRPLFPILALLLLVAAPAEAQRASTLVGVTGGATTSDICCTVNTASRWGGTAGLFAAFRPSRKTVIGLEGHWVQKGGQDLRLDYVEIPLTFGGSIPAGGGDWRTRFYTGISFGFKVSCDSNRASAAFNCDNAKGSEWAWPFGLMLLRVSQNGSLFGLDVRYSYSLSDAFEISSSHNRTWYFRVLYGLPVGGR